MNAAPNLLPPPSPALAVHEVAARIRFASERAAVEVARNSYWSNGWTAGITDALGGYAGDLAALFSPAMAAELADWLDTAASAAARHGEPLPPFALTVTRALTPVTPTTEGVPA